LAIKEILKLCHPFGISTSKYEVLNPLTRSTGYLQISSVFTNSVLLPSLQKAHQTSYQILTYPISSKKERQASE